MSDENDARRKSDDYFLKDAFDDQDLHVPKGKNVLGGVIAVCGTVGAFWALMTTAYIITGKVPSPLTMMAQYEEAEPVPERK